MRNALVVSEIAFACVLLVGAGPPHPQPRQRARRERWASSRRARPRSGSIPTAAYTTPAQRLAYLDDVLRRVSEAPGIERAAITDALPLRAQSHLGRGRQGRDLRARQLPAGVRARGQRRLSRGDGHPDAGGARLLRERHAGQGAGHPGQRDPGANALWPGEDPIGKYIVGPCANERRVVGVVGDVRHLSLEQPSGNEMYIPARQCDDLAGSYLVVRSTLPAGQVAATLRAALSRSRPTWPANDFRTLQQIVDRSVSPRRFTVLLLGGFAVFALVLASLGIYALISYSVTQRTQEIGIRMALGASAGDVQARILGQTLRLAVIGIAIGAGASWLLARGAVRAALRRDRRRSADVRRDAAVLTIVALVAGYLPARRASRIDPMVALRAE